MCGICGVIYLHLERPVDREMPRHMTDIMSHWFPGLLIRSSGFQWNMKTPKS